MIYSITGLVQVARELNRGQYNLDLTVTDGKFNDRKLLTIEVEKSDNSGKIKIPLFYFEDIIFGKKIMEV